jgi:hypothetical protein
MIMNEIQSSNHRLSIEGSELGSEMILNENKSSNNQSSIE